MSVHDLCVQLVHLRVAVEDRDVGLDLLVPALDLAQRSPEARLRVFDRVGDEWVGSSGIRWRSSRPWRRTSCATSADDVLRVLGTFSASTVVSTSEQPFEEDGPHVFVIGAPVAMAAGLQGGVAA